jgi:gluconolactonase
MGVCWGCRVCVCVCWGGPGRSVYHEPSDSFFYCSNAGAPLGFSGSENSNSVYRFSLAEAEELLASDNVFLDDRGDWVGGNVSVQVISGPDGRDGELENVNGGTNYRGEVVFLTQGRGEEVTSGMTLVNPVEPFNSTGA